MNEQTSETNLELDPSVMVTESGAQETEAIDSKYGVSLFEDEKEEYTIYDYDKVNDELYANDSNYNIDVDTNKISSYFTEPVVYNVETKGIDIDYHTLVSTILVIQVLIVIYFIYRIIKVKGSKREKYNNK